MTARRVYLDWNASAPLRPEARAAMLAAMDMVGNPSSVHAEGRAARAIVESARGQVAALVGCEPSEVVFTSGATEAAATLMHAASKRHATGCDHDCVASWDGDRVGPVFIDDNRIFWCVMLPKAGEVSGTSLVDGETGIIIGDYDFLAAEVEAGRAQRLGRTAPGYEGVLFYDMSQALGRMAAPWRLVGRAEIFDAAIFSSEKIGGPQGAGALVLRQGLEIDPLIRGGGQESGRRSGTENVVGIAGFGAAAEAARRDLEDGVWERVSHLRDSLEERLESAAPDLILVGRRAPRLPNTSCFAVPGWAGETQVMQMDLAGFAVSAGSACSSGKVKKASRVLLAMGFDEATASSAIRVSLGPVTTEAEVMAFADAWIDRYRRRNSRAA